MKPCLLFLTCANKKEANKITIALLQKRLIVCAKQMPVNSSFLWKGKIDTAREVLLIMESAEEKFRVVEKEVSRIHSYQTPVLVSAPLSHISKGISQWIKHELKIR